MKRKIMMLFLSLINRNTNEQWKLVNTKAMEENKNEMNAAVEAQSVVVNKEDEAEHTLSLFATLSFYLGLIGGVACILAAFATDQYNLLIAALISTMTGLYTWATLKVFVNISFSLKEINGKIK